MFKVTLSGTLFKEILNSLFSIVTDCRMHVEETGIKVCAVDSSNVAMIILDLSSQAFKEFVCSEPTEIGLDVEKIQKIIEKLVKNDDIILNYESKELKIQIEGYEYIIVPIDPKTIRKDPTKPSLDLPSKFIISGEELSNCIKASEIISDKMVFEVTKEKELLIFKTVAYNENKSQTVTKIFSMGINYLKDGIARSLYSMDYLKNMSKIFKNASEITVSLGINYPIMFDFEFAEGYGKICYLLAPRIEVD